MGQDGAALGRGQGDLRGVGVGLYFAVKGLKNLSLFRWERGEFSRNFRNFVDISIFLLKFNSHFRKGHAKKCHATAMTISGSASQI